jgi:hypothetical protein
MGFYSQLSMLLSDVHHYDDRLTYQQNIDKLTLQLLGLPDPDDAIEAIADALGGEMAGRNWIKAPSPGRSADDRSLVVRVDPARPQDFFVYGESCGQRRAIEHVRATLDLLPAPPAADPADRIRAARQIWDETEPAIGTMVESYLRARGITCPVPASIRFHPNLWHGPSRECLPAMVAQVSTVDGEFQAVHRTWLSGARKARVEPVKMTLGPCAGNTIQLNARPVAKPGALYIGEGIETCLSVMQMQGGLTWVGLSTSGLKTACLPKQEREVVIIADNDEAGESAVARAASRWLNEGRHVLIARPPNDFNDFNDQLMQALRKEGPVS